MSAAFAPWYGFRCSLPERTTLFKLLIFAPFKCADRVNLRIAKWLFFFSAVMFYDLRIYDFQLSLSNFSPQLWQILCDDHLKFNNFLQDGHRKKINPKITSQTTRNVAAKIISLWIELKKGIYDKKTNPIAIKASLFIIFRHFRGFNDHTSIYQVDFLYNIVLYSYKNIIVML